MKLCVALDLPSAKENLELAKKIKDFDVWLKVGFRSYIRDGKEFLDALKQINPKFKIFLDLKLYDIPNTMADAAQEISKLGVDMFNVHASAGKVAMTTVMDRLKDMPNRPLVLAVTALTSFDNDNFKAIYAEDIDKKATQFAKDTYEAGLDGVVSSAFESFDIKQNTSSDFVTLTPGIRPFGEDAGDQKRVADIALAKKELVDFIVVGRPIYKSTNPAEIVEKILKTL
ncbi:MAG: orotidine-5'-phosphate decarboxylase [Campylobacteraceae bacterium]|jgi:orotidine-5'-phosphate decarboxylase|nr:orotidine-5'-phosphate decarboxylase [Campylobacteraceae bacterium]MBT3882563.1 orotidine-5'-phosphate decarboxylase [Campylobacteraceae bacterium]MBT4030403.1 orotidine-5'-phosphate decarboxylase [Campylobacteraceae bacterium]MBT4179651.1 orotidine-5'-phosphate decarboxylase [Campylobacteraceae bacterium]MBT4572592.1 orotidine-5'-phosphate decarboxylase [Campylobacteraceae bacterium]